MRHLYLLLATFLLSLTGLGTEAKERVVEQPVYCVSNTTSIEVDRIVLSDTATILHVRATYRPGYWIQIAPSSYLRDNNGETYPLRRGIGIEPGKEFWMPQSGEAEFSLVFPPLPRQVTAIDFTEGEDVENGFSIWGLQLKTKKLPPLELPQGTAVHPVDRQTPLPAPVAAYGQATLRGQLLDYRPGMSLPLQLFVWEWAKANVSTHELTVQADGTFHLQLPLPLSSRALLRVGESQIDLFLQPDACTEVCVNLRELSRRQSTLHRKAKPHGLPAYFAGPLATVAQELNDLTDWESPMDLSRKTPHAQLTGMDLAQYKTHIARFVAQSEASLKKLDCSLATRQLLTDETRLQRISLLLSAPNELTMAALMQKRIGRQQGQAYFDSLMQATPADYVTAADYAGTDRPQVLLTQDFSALFGLLAKPALMAKTWDQTPQLLADVMHTAALYHPLAEFTPLTEAQLADAATLPDAFRQMLQEENRTLLARIEANKSKTGHVVHEVKANVPLDRLYEQMLAPFRGKTVLVDFWATWCGPCRMANRAMAPMKEELKDRDIVYLYITGETSPLGTWQQMIPDLHGHHYRLTNEQWTYLGQHFGIQGVPTYQVVDPQGRITYQVTGFPGTETIKAELLK